MSQWPPTVTSCEQVPIGLITAAWSGSSIESWMTDAAVRDGTPASLGGNGTCGGIGGIGGIGRPSKPLARPLAMENVDAAAAAAAEVGFASLRAGSAGQGGFGANFNGMIAPLLQMRLTGIWWYAAIQRRFPLFFACLGLCQIALSPPCDMVPSLVASEGTSETRPFLSAFWTQTFTFLHVGLPSYTCRYQGEANDITHTDHFMGPWWYECLFPGP
jgi:hypothetical protein